MTKFKRDIIGVYVIEKREENHLCVSHQPKWKVEYAISVTDYYGTFVELQANTLFHRA